MTQIGNKRMVSVCLNETLFNAIESERGDVKRSTFIEQFLNKNFNKQTV